MLDFYAAPAAMSRLPDHPALAGLPTDLDGLRCVVQGLLMHRELLHRALELSAAPVTQPRPPEQRVLCICRHFALLYTALLRAQGTPARVRCGFSNYFDRAKWYDHWITERWDGARWVRDDPQVDQLQASAVAIDFDPYDQPPGHFLTGSSRRRRQLSARGDPPGSPAADNFG